MRTTNRPPAVTGKAAVFGAWKPDYSRKIDAAAIVGRLQLKPSGRNCWQGNCPACGYADALNLTEKDGKPLWHCHACGDGDAVAVFLHDPYQAPVPLVHRGVTFRPDAHKAAFIREIWQQTLPAAGTVVEHYLAQRGLIGPIPPTLRYLPNCLHTPTGKRFMAMVAAVTLWPSRGAVAIHRTYLKPDGSGKIEHPQARMMLGHASGGAVRLASHGDRLGIAEGIETALSVQQSASLPMWACLSTSGLQNVVVPDDVREVIICADNDPPGLKAAHTAAERLTALGKRVRISTPPQDETDFNDILKGTSHD